MGEHPDVLVLGAGAFGLYGAVVAAERGMQVVVVTPDAFPFARASHANQARLHNGYHYPRSLGTALQASAYYDRFIEEFPDSAVSSFEKIYAIARDHSFTSVVGFERFCHAAGIPLDARSPDEWFEPGCVDAAYACREIGFDFGCFRDRLWDRLVGSGTVDVRFRTRPLSVAETGNGWKIVLSDGSEVRTTKVLNATYASVNQVLRLFGQEALPLSYELCELVLGRPSEKLYGVGITLMDGPFFSLMPFGSSGLHSLSAVDHTPRLTSAGPLPAFSCQAQRTDCSPDALADCATCSVHPGSGAATMMQLARRYLRSDMSLDVQTSLFSVRPVLTYSAVDDSRPTLLVHHRRDPDLVSVFSGKINTIFDLDHVW